MKGRKTTTAQRAAFLEALRQGWSVSGAAAQADLDRTSAYRHRHADAAFAAAWDDAVEQGTDRLVDEARRRAVDGVEEPVYQQGRQVGTVRRYSDRLLIALLKARRPEVFADAVAVSGALAVRHEDVLDVLD